MAVGARPFARRHDPTYFPSDTTVPDDFRELAREMFLREAGAAMVRQVAEVLSVQQIAIMPLKGALLQRLVYGTNRFRSISDVDILVLEPQFDEAHSALTRAGFETVRWERGRWQATLRDPARSPLPIDLHRRLSRTPRSKLTSAGLFERGSTNVELFGSPIRTPSANDLFAHLLLHATGDWISLDRLHRPGDFEAVADALGLDARRCTDHLHTQGLLAHALVLLPLLCGRAASSFILELRGRVQVAADLRARTVARLIQGACRRFPVNHPARRLAALTLAPSISKAVSDAIRDRTVMTGKSADRLPA
jgi:hypothetical protein